jgi:hypothetical protein
MRPIVAALTIIAVSAPAFAADADQNPPKKERRICRESEPTGSRLTTRVCHTKAEWAEIDKANQETATREVQRDQAMARGDGTGYSPN